VRWRRSYEYALREQRSLLAFDGHAYLVSETQGLTSNKLLLYAIDAQNAELLRIFMGGSRSSATTNTWLAPMGHGRLLIHIGDTALLALDTQAAHTAAQDR
jgi:hypothetical protein